MVRALLSTSWRSRGFSVRFAETTFQNASKSLRRVGAAIDKGLLLSNSFKFVEQQPNCAHASPTIHRTTCF
jgi:hypothetical protein